MVQWRIYYADGSTADNTQYEPEDVPAKGVLVIVQRHQQNNVQRLSEGACYYWRRDAEMWFAADQFGMLLQTCQHRRLVTGQMWGETVPNDLFIKIKRQADTDPDFPHRAGGRDPMETPFKDRPNIED